MPDALPAAQPTASKHWRIKVNKVNNDNNDNNKIIIVIIIIITIIDTIKLGNKPAYKQKKATSKMEQLQTWHIEV